MAIEDDVILDVPNRIVDYPTAFVDGRPPSIYTGGDAYSFLQDVVDEPDFMNEPVMISAQTPTQFTGINGWYYTTRFMKAIYGLSFQTSGWVKSGATGITMLRFANGATDAPTVSDEGVTLTGGTSAATGTLLEVDADRQVCWVRNTSVAQFADNENVTGTGVDFQTETTNGFQTGETIFTNLFSVGSLQTETEIYVGQEDDRMGGAAYHTANPEQRRIEKLDEWWDSDVDFTGSPNLIGGLGHFDILVAIQESGATIDGGRLAVFARQLSKAYWHSELVGSANNIPVSFASTGADTNAQDGPYQANFDVNSGTIAVGDVLENDTGTTPVGRLRAVVTGGTGLASSTGTIEYYLIGENEPLATTDRTLRQFLDNENVAVRGGAVTFDIDGAASQVTNGPAQAGGATITFTNTQVDVDEDSSTEEYAGVIDCNNLPLVRVYKNRMFLLSRGNQDGTVADTQDELLPAAGTPGEASEFYRAVGDLIINYDGGIGTQIAEGDWVENSGQTASGVVVSGGTTGMGTTGVLVLTQVKGTFANNDQIARPTEHATNRIDANGTPVGIEDNAVAPMGSFAGGRWTVAQGLVLINVPAADANNWETTDLSGTRRAPPTSRTITFAGLVANDRAALFEVDTAGGNDITKNQNGVASGGAVGAATFVLDTTIALYVTTTGWARSPDASATDGFEQRLAYSSIVGTTVNLDQGAWSTGTTTSAGTATVLNDTGAFTNFGGAGEIRIGMMIRNDTAGQWARVRRKIDNDSIETSPLTSAATWTSGATWTANAPVVAMAASDNCYFGFIDDVATTPSIAKTIKFVSSIDCIARMRFSSPSIGGQRVLPFELTNVTITDADLTVTAIRTDDTIAA